MDEDWRKVAITRPKKVVESAPVSTSPTPHQNVAISCLKHKGKNMDLFCETCGELICLKCIKKGEKHNRHNCEELDEAFERYKSQEIPSSLETIKNSLTQLDKCREEISSQGAAVEMDIHKTVTLDALKNELITQLTNFTHGKLKTLATQRDEIETIEAQLNGHLHFMKEFATTGSEAEIMSKKSSVLGKVEELITSLKPEILEPTAKADIVFSAIDGKVLMEEASKHNDTGMTRNVWLYYLLPL